MTKEDINVTTHEAEDKHYVFISYSNKDVDKVFGEYVIPLYEDGMNVYFDKEFANHATQDWADQMENNMENASLCLAFTSKDYICSYACMLEIFTAIAKNVPILIIKLNEYDESYSTEKRTVSTSTVSHYNDIYQLFNRLPNQDNRNLYYEEIQKANKQLKNGNISKKTVKMILSDCMKKITNTSISVEKNGLSSVKSSIKEGAKLNHIVFDIPKKVVFEKQEDAGKSKSVKDIQPVMEGKIVNTSNTFKDTLKDMVVYYTKLFKDYKILRKEDDTLPVSVEMKMEICFESDVFGNHKISGMKWLKLFDEVMQFIYDISGADYFQYAANLPEISKNTRPVIIDETYYKEKIIDRPQEYAPVGKGFYYGCQYHSANVVKYMSKHIDWYGRYLIELGKATQQDIDNIYIIYEFINPKIALYMSEIRK